VVSVRAEREGLLWFAVLGGAGAWVGHLLIGWLLEEVVACGSGTVPRGNVLGLGVEVWILAETALFGAVAVVAGVIGFRWWRAPGGADPGRSDRRSFMGFAGFVSAVLSVAIIAMGGLQVLTLAPCSP
jgi:hypothetical protein